LSSRMGVIQPKKGVIHPSTASKLSWRLRDPDVRVPVASEGETRDEGLVTRRKRLKLIQKSRRNNSGSEPEEIRS